MISFLNYSPFTLDSHSMFLESCLPEVRDFLLLLLCFQGCSTSAPATSTTTSVDNFPAERICLWKDIVFEKTPDPRVTLELKLEHFHRAKRPSTNSDAVVVVVQITRKRSTEKWPTSTETRVGRLFLCNVCLRTGANQLDERFFC